MMLMVNLGEDVKLLEWLTSNPVAEVYSMSTPVMGLQFETTRVTRRGKIVPDSRDIDGDLRIDTRTR